MWAEVEMGRSCRYRHLMRAMGLVDRVEMLEHLEAHGCGDRAERLWLTDSLRWNMAKAVGR